MHHILVKTALFLVSGISYRLLGSYELRDLGGLYRKKPFLAILFLIPALSLAGIPPLSGFFAKFIVLRAGIEAEAYVVTGIALLVGLLTMYSMIKIWAEVFWKATPEHTHEQKPLTDAVVDRGHWPLYVPIMILGCGTLLIGFYGQPIFVLAEQAAAQLLNPQGYIDAVLGVQP